MRNASNFEFCKRLECKKDIGGEIDDLMKLAKAGIDIVGFDTTYIKGVSCFENIKDKGCLGFVEKWYDDPFGNLAENLQPGDEQKCAEDREYTDKAVSDALNKSKDSMLVGMREQSKEKKKISAASILKIAQFAYNKNYWINDLQGFLSSTGVFRVADPGELIESSGMGDDATACFYNWTCSLVTLLDSSLGEQCVKLD